MPPLSPTTTLFASPPCRTQRLTHREHISWSGQSDTWSQHRIAPPSLRGRARLMSANPGIRRSIEGEPSRCRRVWLAVQGRTSITRVSDTSLSTEARSASVAAVARGLTAARACRVCLAGCVLAVIAGSDLRPNMVPRGPGWMNRRVRCGPAADRWAVFASIARGRGHP
jgi:hypothetical protein